MDMSTIHHYFNELGVSNSRHVLLNECERRGVKVKEHSIHKRLLCLNYKDEVQYNKSWDNFNRRCRGLVMNSEEGINKIISHPFDKFFNANEMPETSYETLAAKGSFTITEKLDGRVSCVATISLPDGSTVRIKDLVDKNYNGLRDLRLRHQGQGSS